MADVGGEGVAVTVEAGGDGALGGTGGEGAADIGIMTVERMGLLGGFAAFGSSDMFAFGFETCEGFAGALGDEVTFDLRREGESESKDFGLDVIAESVTIFDRPDATSALHTEAEDLHDHEEAASEAA